MWRCVSSLLLVLTMVQTVRSAPTIQAPWATVQGVSMEGDGGRKMNAYLAIPYALPPVGDLRFEKPQPHPGLGKGEVFVADQIMPACPQMLIMIGASRKMSEDCLMLDVYTPVGADGNTSPRAVMVFIHGGAFDMGDAYSYRPGKLVVDGDVVVVVIQYRLAALGFLTSDDGVLPGNLGLWDQNLALKWVQRNIRAFGGDPDMVTIFGESAGSMSVGLQMLSPQSRGLFKRAIMQSGGPQRYMRPPLRFDAKQVFRDIAGLLDCTGDDSAQLVQCMKGKTAEELLNKSSEYAAKGPLQSYFFPSVDGEFITDDLSKLAQDKDFMVANGVGDVDLMIGFTNKEGGIMVHMETLGMADMFPDGIKSASMVSFCTGICLDFTALNDHPMMRKSVEFFYYGAEAGSSTFESIVPVAEMQADCTLVMPTIEWARYLVNSPHTAARYMYVLDHDFAFNREGMVPGAHHGDDLILLFDYEREMPKDSIFVVINKTSLAPEEQPVESMAVQIWTTFAKTGNPSAPIQEAVGGEWPEYTTEEEAYLSISESPRVVTKLGPFRDGVALWNTHLPYLSELVPHLPAEEPAQEESTSKDEL